VEELKVQEPVPEIVTLTDDQLFPPEIKEEVKVDLVSVPK
jgi:hypothetical protein